jgi:ethanolamine utilization protein EutA
MSVSHTPGSFPRHDDHDFEDGEEEATLEDNPIWQQENVTLMTVGIDIGSSGTQLLFSELKLRRSGTDLSTRYVVIERSCVYESPVSFTPFAGGLIDGRALGEIIDLAYSAAGIAPESVETGVVILTGEALRRENAEQIATVVARKAGDFVCAAAGHHMEARLAAFGSGAVAHSAETGGRILNVDIGGGTTKLSVVASGRVLVTAALSVGGRLIAVDEADRVVRLEDAGRAHAAAAQLAEPRLGAKLGPDHRRAIAESMADVLVAALSGATETVPYLTEPAGDLGTIDGVIFSGGVSEYLYGLEHRDFGDLGPALARAIADRLANGAIGFPLLPAAACIRATAIGASQFSVQLSGNTYFASDAATLLPRRNLPVVRPPLELGGEIDSDAVASCIARHVAAFGAGSESDVVLALSWSGAITHARLSALGAGVVRGLGGRPDNDRPILLAVDADIAKNLGHLMRDELGVHAELLVLDGLTLLDFDYIDLGRPRQPSGVVPVTIKSLVF